MLERLPGLSALDVRRLDHDVDKPQIVGATAGFVLATLLLSLGPLLASAARRLAGWPWGHVALVAYKLVVVYVAVLLLAHWSAVDDTE